MSYARSPRAVVSTTIGTMFVGETVTAVSFRGQGKAALRSCAGAG